MLTRMGRSRRDTRTVVSLVTAPSVRERAGTASAVVRVRELAEPPGADRRPSLQECPGDAVHAVHDAVAGPEDHRVRQVRLRHAAEVLGDLPYRGPLLLIESVLRVDFRQVTEGNLFGRQAGSRARRSTSRVSIPPSPGQKWYRFGVVPAWNGRLFRRSGTRCLAAPARMA